MGKVSTLVSSTFIVLGLVVNGTFSWNYEDEDTKGVFRWGDQYPECDGLNQSPIDIETARVQVNRDLTVEIGGLDETHETWIRNNGHTAQLGLLDSPKPNLTGTAVNGKLYEFAQLHFHWGEKSDRGSEHSVDSVFYPAEMHMVFYRKQYGDIETAVKYKDGLAVVGVFLQNSKTNNPNYDPLIYAVRQAPDYKAKSFLPSEITLRQLLPRNTQKFYRYSGSLTTPPCDEIVTWILLADPVEIGEQQLEVFRHERTNYVSMRSGSNRIDHNYRYQAPINRRIVESSFNPRISFSTPLNARAIKPFYKNVFFPSY